MQYISHYNQYLFINAHIYELINYEFEKLMTGTKNVVGFFEVFKSILGTLVGKVIFKYFILIHRYFNKNFLIKHISH